MNAIQASIFIQAQAEVARFHAMKMANDQRKVSHLPPVHSADEFDSIAYNLDHLAEAIKNA